MVKLGELLKKNKGKNLFIKMGKYYCYPITDKLDMKLIPLLGGNRSDWEAVKKALEGAVAHSRNIEKVFVSECIPCPSCGRPMTIGFTSCIYCSLGGR